MLSDIDKQDIDRKDTEHHHSIGEHICALRVSKGWTQQTLGKKPFSTRCVRHRCRAGFYILVLCDKALRFYAKFVETRNEPCYFNSTITHNLQRFPA